jgi:isocitrate/isopropylmalate dehydrogenase
MSDGLFLESVREVAKKYPSVEFKEMIIDNTCMQVPYLIIATPQRRRWPWHIYSPPLLPPPHSSRSQLVQNPRQFDVLVRPEQNWP